MRRTAAVLVWAGIAILGATAFGVLALARGETINAAWLLTAAVCTYAVGYRFYARFLAARVFGLDDRRATPAERLSNNRDFVPTNRWVLYGHHFAAIAGAGPLVGPVLAAQFGFLPGTLWLVIGVVLGGAVQDFTILVASMRRDGKSLGQMAKEEVNRVAGVTGMLAVLFIMVILLAVLALIVVNALRDSPWGLFTIACTVPIALLMGWWMKVWRPGRVGEASAVGAVLLLGALVAGGWVASQPQIAAWFRHSGTTLTWMMMAYGFVASVLPVWVLLCPRDYLSTFLKVTTGPPVAGGGTSQGCAWADFDIDGDAARFLPRRFQLLRLDTRRFACRRFQLLGFQARCRAFGGFGLRRLQLGGFDLGRFLARRFDARRLALHRFELLGFDPRGLAGRRFQQSFAFCSDKAIDRAAPPDIELWIVLFRLDACQRFARRHADVVDGDPVLRFEFLFHALTPLFLWRTKNIQFGIGNLRCFRHSRFFGGCRSFSGRWVLCSSLRRLGCYRRFGCRRRARRKDCERYQKVDHQTAYSFCGHLLLLIK